MEIFIKDVNGNNTIYDPLINAIIFDDGCFEYITVNRVNGIPKIISRSKESYEEGAEALKNQNP